MESTLMMIADRCMFLIQEVDCSFVDDFLNTEDTPGCSGNVVEGVSDAVGRRDAAFAHAH